MDRRVAKLLLKVELSRSLPKRRMEREGEVDIGGLLPGRLFDSDVAVWLIWVKSACFLSVGYFAVLLSFTGFADRFVMLCSLLEFMLWSGVGASACF